MKTVAPPGDEQQFADRRVALIRESSRATPRKRWRGDGGRRFRPVPSASCGLPLAAVFWQIANAITDLEAGAQVAGQRRVLPS